MPHLKEGLSFKLLLSSFSSVVFHTVVFLHLLWPCAGQSQVVGPSQPIVVTAGDDIILPCQIEPALDASVMTVEWTRPDLNPRFVHVWRDGVELENKKHPSYNRRTSVSVNKLRCGDISLKLSKVRLSDSGKYRCFIPTLGRESTVELVVGVISSVVISLERNGKDEVSSGLALKCNSSGWYPEPEVFWLDGEGNLLSAGPTETVRGPDDLYTVSSRVTVEKRHSNSFTCRVQQNHTNQIREAHIHVPDDFFEVQSSSSSTTAGLVVSLAVCILVILIIGFFVWKWRQNIFKSRRSLRDEPYTGVKPNLSRCQKTEDQVVTEDETERQQLLTDETDQIKELKERQAAGIRPEEEQLRRREAENRLKTLIEDLEYKKTEIRQKQSDLQQLREEKKKKKENMKKLKEHLENKKTESQKKTLQSAVVKHWLSLTSKKEQKKKNGEEDAEKEVENLKLATEGPELDTKTKERETKLQEEQMEREEPVETLKTDDKTELEENKAADNQCNQTSEGGGASPPPGQDEENSSPVSQNSTTGPAVVFKVDALGQYIQLRNTSDEVEHQQDKVKDLTEEKMRSEAERQKLQTELKEKLSDLQQLDEEKKKKKEEVKRLKEQLENKKTESQKKTLQSAVVKHWLSLTSKKEQKKKNGEEDAEKEVENLKLATEGPELDTKTKERETKLQEEQMEREEPVETLKTDDKTELEENKAADNQCNQTSEGGGASPPPGQDEENSSPVSQNSTTGPAVVFKVDALGQYIQLRNTSDEVEHQQDKVKDLTEEKMRSEAERQKLQTELKEKLSDLQQLDEEKKKKKEEVKRLKEQLENKKTESQEKTLQSAVVKHWSFFTSKKQQQKKKKGEEDTEKEVENLGKQLETEGPELDTKTKQTSKKQQQKKKKGEEDTEKEVENLKLETEGPELNTKTKQREKKLQEEQMEREEPLETLKTEDKTELEENKAADNQCNQTSEGGGASPPPGQDEENSSPVSQNSTTGPAVVFKVDALGQYIQLRNTSDEEQQLGGWSLMIQVNNNKPIIHKLKEPSNLKAYQHFTVGSRGYGRTDPPAHLVLKDLKSWSYSDKLQVSLISYNGKIPYNLDRIY
ncbi:uncharacterized protein AB9X84_015553 isoform 4-T4 [Acanthopagrus schlegelii]